MKEVQENKVQGKQTERIEQTEHIEQTEQMQEKVKVEKQDKPNHNKSGKTQRKILALLLACILVIIALFAFNTKMKIQHYSLESEKLTAPVRIVLITDLHSCSYGEGQRELIDAIHAQKPDIILLGGDICDDKLPHRNTELVLRAIADKYPCYYVTGNHEYWSREIEKILKIFESYNVPVLEGSFDTIDVRGQKLNICGISDPDILKYTDKNYSITEQLKDAAVASENGNYSILLAHRPELIDSYLNYDFDLILAGHAHGGQWRLPGIINGLFAPNQGFFPRYAGGKYRFEDSFMIVSRGLARESTRIPRIFNRPELVVIDLS